MKEQFRINNRILARELRVIDENGIQIGILPFREAYNLAQSKELDLVEVNGSANPPVAKLLDYSKFIYEQNKKYKNTVKAKPDSEVRLNVKIADHDLLVKIKTIRRLLSDGSKVKVSILFKGREITHPQLGSILVDKMRSMVEDIGVVEKEPAFEGKRLFMVIAPNKKKVASNG